MAEVLVLFHLLDLVPAHRHGTHDVPERKRIGFAGDFYQQRAHDGQRKRQFQMEVEPAAGLLRDRRLPRTARTMSCTASSPRRAPRLETPSRAG